jgi:F-box-like
MSAGDVKFSPSSSPTKLAEGFDKLSDQMLLEILSYVPHDDYLNIRLVNRRFNRISTDRSLWKKVSFALIYDELTPGRRDYP